VRRHVSEDPPWRAPVSIMWSFHLISSCTCAPRSLSTLDGLTVAVGVVMIIVLRSACCLFCLLVRTSWCVLSSLTFNLFDVRKSAMMLYFSVNFSESCKGSLPDTENIEAQACLFYCKYKVCIILYVSQKIQEETAPTQYIFCIINQYLIVTLMSIAVSLQHLYQGQWMIYEHMRDNSWLGAIF
jgi:hypothetical protein